MLIKYEDVFIVHKKHSVQLIRTEQRYDNNKPLGRLAKKKVIQKFRLSLEKRNESISKLLKDKILQVNNFLLLNLLLFSYRERVISKHLTLVLAYVSITNKT